MLTTSVMFVTILGLLIYIFQHVKHKNTLLPPGPRGLPLVGNLLQFVGTKPHLKMSQWAQQYGKLYTIRFGSKPVLVISDLKMMREIFALPAASSNPITEITEMIPNGRWGLHAEGEARLEQRQFLIRVIRKFGFGEASCKEALIKQEVKQILAWIKSEQKHKGKVYLKEILKRTSANVLWTICSGEQFQPDLKLNIVVIGVHFMKDLHKVIKNGLLFCPWIKYLAPKASGYNQYKNACDNLHKYVKNALRQHILTRVKGEEPQNIIDAYIDRVESCKDKESSFYGDVGWRHCVSNIVTLFIAAGDGIGLVINWIIFYLTVHQNVQQKVQEEIEEVIGSQRDVNLEDKRNMPYTEAVILETLRFSSLMAIGVTHELTENITFQGYRLPKGMLIQPVLYYVHFDKAIWGDPAIFRPGRFLGNGIKLKEFVVPFQMGKKVCLGQQIAHDFIFLNATTLLQKYTFEVDRSAIDDVKEYLEPLVELALEPKPLPILAIERQ